MNPMNSFTLAAARSSACPNGLLQPTQGPDGLQFSQEKQSVRLQYADNINFGKSWMVGMWVKSFAGVPSPRNETLLTTARFDNRNDTPHSFSFGLLSNPLAMSKTGIRFSAFLLNATSQAYQYVEFTFQNKLDIQDGWVLLMFGIDNLSNPSTTTFYYKMRTSLTTSKEYGTFAFTGLQWAPRSLNKQDIYLGGFCDLFNAAAVYGNPFRGTVSRLYIWANIANVGILADFYNDQYYFRTTSPVQQPTCAAGTISGALSLSIPCKMCIVGPSPPTSYITKPILTCLSTTKTFNSMYIAYWNFATVTNQNFASITASNFINDLTGNGYLLYKNNPANAGGPQPFIMSNQGLLFEAGMYAIGSLPIMLQNYNQFTIDMWVRRESVPPVSNTATNAFAFLIDKKVAGVYQLDFGIQISDTNQKIFVTMGNLTMSSPTFTSILVDNTWNYFAVSIYRYQVGAAKYCRIRFMSNVDNMNAAINCPAGYNDLAVTQANTMSLVSYRSYIFNRIRVYDYALNVDEIPSMVMTSAATNCVKKMGQQQCTICPEDGNCLTQCNQNQFENIVNQTCDTCDAFCGGCAGPSHNDCTFCTRQANAPTFFNPQLGNCTCNSGTYYNSTSNVCETCNPLCGECFGPQNTHCLTCAPTSIFFHPTYCVSNCSDTLVIGDGAYGFFMDNETVSGAAGYFSMCIECHPYCTVCFGTQNGNCTSCQNGFFLQGTSCINNCPLGQYPNMLLKKCTDCDVSCNTCSGPVSSQCTQCNQTNAGGTGVIKYLQPAAGGYCKLQCDPGYYPDNYYACQRCHIACQTCTSSRNTSCGSCNSRYFLQWLGFACQNGCFPGQYGDSATNMCLLCHYSCLTCSGAGPDMCTVCAVGYLRRKSLCVTQCADGEFVVDGTCLACDKKCLTCFGPSDNQCTTCADNTETGLGYYHQGNNCVETCPDGSFPDNFAKVCSPCPAVCSGCFSFAICTSCITGPYQLNNGECNYFSCMNTQYRAVTPTLACYDCDKSCLTCQGMSRFDCLTCVPQDLFKNNTCITCAEQSGMASSPDPTYPGCVEICGDGYNFGMVQCDDGNLQDGDGCSSKCQVEPGWNCTGGSKLMADTCYDIKSPTPSIRLINKENQIYLTFDKEVVITEDLSSGPPKFTLSVVGKQPSYKFDWYIQADVGVNDHIQSLIIYTTFYQSLTGEEQITINILDAHTFEDGWGNGMVIVPLTGSLYAFQFVDPFWGNFLQGIATYVLLGIVAIGALNIVLAQFYNVSTTAFWTTILYIQMASLVPLMSVNWAQFVEIFVGKIGMAINFEFTLLPNLIFDLFIAPAGKKTLLEPALNAQFASYQYGYSNFFYLAGRKLILWGILLVSYPIIWYLKANYADKHKFCKVWEKLEQRFRYVFFLRGIILCYTSMVLASTLNIYNMELVNLSTMVSCFASIAFQIAMVYLPIHIMNILQKHYDKLENPKFLAQYNTIISELDLSHPSKYMYYSMFFLRRIIFAFLIVLFSGNPVMEVATQGATSMFFILYVLIAKPFKRRVTAILTVIGELFVVALYMVGMAITDPNQPDAMNQQFGFLIIMIFCLLMLVGAIGVIVQVSQDVLAECRRRNEKDQDHNEQHEHEYKYKKWKKRRQLVKREGEQKGKQSIMDQHEGLVEQYRRHQEEEEERKAREEEEKELREQEEADAAEAAENGDDYGDQQDGQSRWNGDETNTKLNGYQDAYAMYEASHQAKQQQQQVYEGPREVSTPQQIPKVLDVRQLNRDSGSSSGEHFQERLKEQVAEFYGDEDGYGDEYAAEVEEPEQAQAPPIESNENTALKENSEDDQTKKESAAAAATADQPEQEHNWY